MTNSIIADKQPKAVNLEHGKEYYFCSCGHSSQQPFCDGSHDGTGLTPLSFTPKKSGTAYLCQCKQTKNPPYCDGTHADL